MTVRLKTLEQCSHGGRVSLLRSRGLLPMATVIILRCSLVARLLRSLVFGPVPLEPGTLLLAKLPWKRERLRIRVQFDETHELVV